MSEPYVGMAFGATAPDEESRAYARQQLHDQLIAAHPIRLGPVEWRTYDGSSAREILERAELLDHPHGRGLLDWLAGMPGGELVVASVLIPEPRDQTDD